MIGILVIGVAVILFEVPPLLKNKERRELTIFSLFLLTGITFNILLSFNVELPNPSDWLLKLFSPMDDFIERIFS
ncbi:hypothetical protein [Niallia sp. Krafla_26]|uniref:hypothetical protein n=1 Tax=Niallia sp. Krafla_26 TaxID=3064703 RepID=UPI003D1721B9